MNRGISCSFVLAAGADRRAPLPRDHGRSSAGPAPTGSGRSYRALVRISLLGPLQVEGEPGTVVLGAAKERSLLSALALTPGSIVSTDALIAALWGDDPPAAARKTLQTYVWNLRQALGADVDLHRAAGLCAVRRRRRRRRQPVPSTCARRRATPCATRLTPSRSRGRSPRPSRCGAATRSPGVASHTGLATEAVRLKEEYLSALEARIAADLADGRHAELVGELEALVRDHPFREKLWGSLMVALYRCGRQADALAAYQRVRELLLEELGLEPGGELRRLEAAILDHDPVAWRAADAARRAVRQRARPARPLPGALRPLARRRQRRLPGRRRRPDRHPRHRRASSATSTSGGTHRRTASCAGSRRWAASSPSTSGAWVCPTARATSTPSGGSTTHSPCSTRSESERAVVLGVSAGAPTAIRCSRRSTPSGSARLILHGGFARSRRRS